MSVEAWAIKSPWGEVLTTGEKRPDLAWLALGEWERELTLDDGPLCVVEIEGYEENGFECVRITEVEEGE